MYLGVDQGIDLPLQAEVSTLEIQSVDMEIFPLDGELPQIGCTQ